MIFHLNVMKILILYNKGNTDDLLLLYTKFGINPIRGKFIAQYDIRIINILNKNNEMFYKKRGREITRYLQVIIFECVVTTTSYISA